jgi:hypothetical protein
MKQLAAPIFAPVSIAETTVLRAYATQALPDVSAPSLRVEWATTTQALVMRGFLAKTDRGVLVTPEGLAALLDTVDIDTVMRTAARPAATEDAAAGAATRPSRARRTSAGSSSRSGRAAS